MKCPNCNVSLVITDRSGVEIDYCPECRGVWLDRGELDKIIERAAQYIAPTPTSGYDNRQQKYGHDDRQTHYGHDPRYKKKKDSFLGDLFDF